MRGVNYFLLLTADEQRKRLEKLAVNLSDRSIAQICGLTPERVHELLTEEKPAEAPA
jgi:hypothetical protein